MKNWHTTFVVGIVVAIVVALLLFRVSPAAAPEEDYPTRSINLYIGSPPGGSLDLSGRVLAERLISTLGEQVVIVNKPGGTQTVAFAFVSNARPDGYSLVYVLNPYLTMKKIEEPGLPFDPSEMTWLGSMYKFNFMLTVRADSPWQTYEEFVDFAKTNPDEVVFGSDGGGGAQHIAQLQFAELAGIESFTHVPFAGGGRTVVALLGGHVDAITTSPGPTAAYVKSGDLRYLVNLAPRRNPEFPDVPSTQEKGMILTAGGWMGFAGPRDLPAAIAEKLTEALYEAATTDEAKAIFKEMGWEYDYRPPEDNLRMWQEEETIYGEQMRRLGLIR